jgi:hypothetical protein
VTHGWEVVSLTTRDLISHIEAGKPFAVGLYRNNHRSQENFIASELVALDIDSNVDRPLTKEEYLTLLQDPFIQTYACAVIQSSSSQEGAYKARVLFRLDQPITELAAFRRLMGALMQLFPIADKACKDGARFFWGGKPGRLADFVAEDNRLPITLLEEEATAQESAKTQARAKTQATAKAFRPRLGEGHNERELVEIALSYLPDGALAYDEWLSVLMALSTVPYGLELAQQWTSDTQMRLEQRFASFKTPSITLGTLFHLAQGYGFQFPSTVSQQWTQSQHFADPLHHQTYAVRYLNEAIGVVSAPSLLIKSPIGTGKTEWLVGQLRDKARFLVVVHRRSLTRNITRRLNEAGLEVASYDEKHWGNKLVITYNSLHKLIHKGSLPDYDVIVLDEVEQGLAHLTGKTFKDAEGLQAFWILRALLRQSRQIIGMDADASRLSYEFFGEVRPEDTPLLIENTYPMQRGKMFVFDNLLHVMTLMIRALRGGHRIAVACDSRSRAELAHRMVKEMGYRVRVVHGDNSDFAETQSFLANVTEEVNKLNCFIYTSSVGTGVDIQADVDFVFGLFENRTVNAFEQLQMLGRCRRAKAFFVGSSRQRNAEAATPEEIKTDYLENITKLGKLGIRVDFDAEGKFHMTRAEMEFLDFCCQIEGQESSLMSSPRALFLFLARREYELILKESSIPPKRLRERIKRLRDIIKRERQAAILAASPVDDDTYREAKLRQTSNAEIEAGHQHWIIERFYHQPVTLQLIDHAENGGILRLKHFILYHRKMNDWVLTDQDEQNRHVPLPQRQFITPKLALAQAIIEVVYPDGIHFERINENDLKPLYPEIESIYTASDGNRVFKRDKRAGQGGLATLRYMLRFLGLKLVLIRGWNRKREYQIRELESQAGLALIRLIGMQRYQGVDPRLIEKMKDYLKAHHAFSNQNEQKTSRQASGQPIQPTSGAPPPPSEGHPQADLAP